jgi:hypothetical protein
MRRGGMFIGERIKCLLYKRHKEELTPDQANEVDSGYLWKYSLFIVIK